MDDKEIYFSKTIIIEAPAAKVWAALTDTELMKQWMSETPIEIVTDWKIGSPVIIRGALYKKGFENRGTVLAFVPGERLMYTHLSSLSRLPDSPESYTVFDFLLEPMETSTLLVLTIHNFPTDTIYNHLAFYWNVTMELLKKFIEHQ